MYEVAPIILRRKNTEELDFVDNYNFNFITHKIYEAGKFVNVPKISIGVLGYRNIDQTKRCVESVLKYIKDVDYELILVDNGSKDNNKTYNYFQSVPTVKKEIIRVEEPIGKNYGAVYGTQIMYKFSKGDYFLFLGNDNIITENAIQNMIRCLDSSADIGLVTPMSSNVWMLQNPGLSYSNYEEMFIKAKQFNIYDPRKWQERMTIATVATAVKREAIDRIGFYDLFAESSLCMRMRQAGYKTILLGDTWVCHDHDYSTKKDSQPWIGESERAKYINETNKKISEKYFCMDTFKDIMVFELELIQLLEVTNSDNITPNILAVDVRCGQGMLDLKNKLRSYGVFETSSVAFTTSAKYYKWLETVADKVCCDRIDFIDDALERCIFDYIIVGEPINLYKEPIILLKKLLKLLNKGGQLIFKVRNTSDYFAFLKIVGVRTGIDGDMAIHISVNDICNYIKNMGYENVASSRKMYNYNQSTVDQLIHLLKGLQIKNSDINNTVLDILTRDYNLCIRNY